MKHLKDTLKNLPKPDPDVSEFKSELRRRVLGSPVPTRASHPLMMWSAASTLGLAAVLVLFIVKPEIPVHMHTHLWGQQPEYVAQIGQTAPETSSDAGETPWDWPTLDADRELVERWVEHQYGQTSPVVQPVDTGEIFAVRKFRLTDGRQVLVYTALPESQDPIPVGF